MSQTRRTYIADIEGGQHPAEILPDKDLTIDDIWKTYRWYPGFAEMHDLAVKAIWGNGLTDDSIQEDRILELKDGHLFAYLAGYTAYICNTFTDPPSVESWHPVIDGIGFRISEVAEDGYPIEIEITQKLQEIPEPLVYKVPNYPVETINIEIGKNKDGSPLTREIHIRSKPKPEGYGFFIIRNRRGLRGIRGLPEYMPLIHPIRAQHDILMAYGPFAKKQGMGFPAVYLADISPKKRQNVKDQMATQPQTNRMLILSNEDLVEWIQPLAQSYDPFPILNWVDLLIARKTQMNKLMLTGDPAGYLSASETAISNWEREVKENQRFWQSQFEPIFKVLGGSEDCTFQDPSRPSFMSLMEGLEKCKNALMGIVENEDIVDLMNEYLQRSDKKWRLTAISNEEMMQNAMMQQGGDANGNTGGTTPNRYQSQAKTNQ